MNGNWAKPSPWVVAILLIAANGVLAGCIRIEHKDSPLRAYIRDALEPYLDSLAYQICQVKYEAAPEAPGRLPCPGPPEGYNKPPGNGKP
ncbi:MAG TPA: hypothetical protein VFZ90_16155 [Gemmatimonadales bacterium]